MSAEVCANTVSAAWALVEFLGVQLDKADQLILHIAFIIKPDWLKGKHRYHHLPRVADSGPNWTFIPIGALTRRELATRVIWIVENLHENWNISEDGFGFENETEAMHFRLKWS